MGTKALNQKKVNSKRLTNTTKVKKVKAVEEEQLELPSSDSEVDTSDSAEGEDVGDDEEENDGSDEEQEEQDDDFNGFSSSESEAEDDDDTTIDQTSKSEHNVKPLPKQLSQKQKKSASGKKGVIYIGRLPNGFEEKELSKYFNQFGQITNVKLIRNKKTGNSKHFGFIEFTNIDDAKVAQETMNNYLLMNHQLKVEIVDDEFKSSKRFRKNYSKPSELKKSVGKLNSNDAKKRLQRRNSIKAAGINF